MVNEINAGMEPEKPKGTINSGLGIVILTVVIALVAGGIWWWYKKTAPKEWTGTINLSTTSPSASASASASTSTLPSASASAETADWKTYNNSTYGLSVKYPPKAELYENTMKGEEKYLIIFNDKTGCGNDAQCSDINFNIHILDNPGNLNAKQWIDARYSSPIELKQSLTQAGITVDGLQGEKVASTWGDAGFKVVFVQHPTKTNLMFEIYYDGKNSGLENSLNLFINTFKFL